MSGCLVVRQPSSSGRISEATVELQRGAVTPKQCISSQPPVVHGWGVQGGEHYLGTLREQQPDGKISSVANQCGGY